MFTLAISKCYGKVWALFSKFPGDNSLVSRGKSHSSRGRGLVVRCLLFNPEVPCSNPCICANFFTSISKQKVLTFLALWDSPFFGFVRLFFENFLMSPKCPPFNLVDILQQNECLKIPKGPFFQILRHYETVKISHFFRKFFKDSKGSSLRFFFEILQQNEWRFFKRNNFCRKISSQAQHAISD